MFWRWYLSPTMDQWSKREGLSGLVKKTTTTTQECGKWFVLPQKRSWWYSNKFELKATLCGNFFGHRVSASGGPRRCKVVLRYLKESGKSTQYYGLPKGSVVQRCYVRTCGIYPENAKTLKGEEEERPSLPIFSEAKGFTRIFLRWHSDERATWWGDVNDKVLRSQISHLC